MYSILDGDHSDRVRGHAFCTVMDYLASTPEAQTLSAIPMRTAVDLAYLTADLIAARHLAMGDRDEGLSLARGWWAGAGFVPWNVVEREAVRLAEEIGTAELGLVWW